MIEKIPIPCIFRIYTKHAASAATLSRPTQAIPRCPRHCGRDRNPARRQECAAAAVRRFVAPRTTGGLRRQGIVRLRAGAHGPRSGRPGGVDDAPGRAARGDRRRGAADPGLGARGCLAERRGTDAGGDLRLQRHASVGGASDADRRPLRYATGLPAHTARVRRSVPAAPRRRTRRRGPLPTLPAHRRSPRTTAHRPERSGRRSDAGGHGEASVALRRWIPCSTT